MPHRRDGTTQRPPTLHVEDKLSRRRAGISIAARRHSREAVSVTRDESVQARPEPPQRREARNPTEPDELWQRAQDCDPSFKSPQPLPIRGADVHFAVELGPRIRRHARDFRVVIIQKPQPLAGIEGFNPAPAPLTERAGAVEEDLELGKLRHRVPATRIMLRCPALPIN